MDHSVRGYLHRLPLDLLEKLYASALESPPDEYIPEIVELMGEVIAERRKDAKEAPEEK